MEDTRILVQDGIDKTDCTLSRILSSLVDQSEYGRPDGRCKRCPGLLSGCLIDEEVEVGAIGRDVRELYEVTSIAMTLGEVLAMYLRLARHDCRFRCQGKKSSFPAGFC